MFIAKGLIRYTFLISSIFLILICSLAVLKAGGISALGCEAPIYKIPLSENTQRNIWKLCEGKKLAYELVLSIFHVEGIKNPQIDYIKAEIEKLVYLRDYWTEQGFPDEIVFDLMLLSKQRGIEGCQIFIKDNDYYVFDNYVQDFAQYKYYLEQSLDEPLFELYRYGEMERFFSQLDEDEKRKLL